MIEICSFYREVKKESIGVGIGFCDLDGLSTICGGDIQFCEKPEELKNYLSNEKKREIQEDYFSLYKRWLEFSKQKAFTYKVLIVDDNKDVVEMVERVLSSKGHKVEGVQSGREALKKMESNKFDAVILDIVMPEMDGITLLKKILERYPEMPVMVMTGFTEEYSSEIAIFHGAREFIKKPFSVTEFLVRFNKMMKEVEMINLLKIKSQDSI